MESRLDLSSFINDLPPRGSRRTYEFTLPSDLEKEVDQALSSGYVEAHGEELRIVPDGLTKKIEPHTEEITYRLRLASDYQ